MTKKKFKNVTLPYIQHKNMAPIDVKVLTELNIVLLLSFLNFIGVIFLLIKYKTSKI